MSVPRLEFRRLAATLALAAWIVGLAAPAVVAHDDVDVTCGDVAWTSDHERAAFEDVRPPVDGGHCELCHHQRLLRGMVLEARAMAAVEPVADVHRGVPVKRAKSAARSNLPSRAPPALLI